MKIIQALLSDHERFYRQFDELERSLPAGPLDELRAQLAELDMSLGTHAQLEDELLFATLEPLIGTAGPLSVMRMEHDEIEETLAQLRDAVEIAETQQLVRHLLEVARPHFMKEEHVLFPMAEQILSAEKLDDLGAQFENKRRVVMI